MFLPLSYFVKFPAFADFETIKAFTAKVFGCLAMHNHYLCIILYLTLVCSV
ncbi:hypothetical protein NBO_598g0002 [Nosema bombycis CQ1]|uniref:Uncharacterized protein n=1 Tax=Nosema bombycis (strain CQ1 / CVCC 102059) TaxID=578461 RepID=R0MD56_NOSB1|nr:hypothetical protein NBO_598g0002 [Nosema bombycis CQ1]|eukprot:EOB11995.1 hypothetical protein NBO_598g0002 [Nosema bombycis CQ1]